MKTTLSLLSAALLAAPVTTFAVDYQTEIFPIFKDQCFQCHGNGESKGNFSLDAGEIENHIKASGAIRPGKSDRSDLYKSLINEDEDERMPLEKPPLSAEQISLIKQWIEDGAVLGSAAEKEKDKDDADSPEKPKTDEADSEEKMSSAPAEKPKPITGAWTNAEGKTIQATLTGIDGDNVIFRLANDQSVPYALSKLSAESQEIARAFAEAMKAAEN